MNILLVCTGNTCRSPLAEVLLRRALTEAGVDGVEVSSAGTGAMGGEGASEGSYLVALEHGLDLASHRARPVTRGMLAGTDLALTMSRSHLRKLELLGAQGRAHLLGDYAGAKGDREVADPVGGPIEGYRATYQQLEEMTRSVARRIAEEARRDRR
ncbi:MAG: low molecular weight protein arginine phosphatase [Gemmatimonadetes bacterium]|nr:low molecular weight protein arginine phosphatase [Gemmatimonadota bacterium]